MNKLITIFFALILAGSVKAQSYLWADHIEQYLYAVAQVRSTATDVNDNIYISGWFNDTVDFDPGPAENKIFGSSSFFILKLDENGNFGWVKTFDVNAISGLAGDLQLDAAGNIYASGAFYQACDFDPGAGVVTLTPTYYDIFILKLNASGDYVWAKQIAGPGFGSATGYAFDVDATGNVYAGGNINGTYDFDPNAGTANLGTPGNNSGWVMKWDMDGNYIWSKEITSTWSATVTRITSASNGDVYYTGACYEVTDMDPGAGTYNFADTSHHVFISKLDASGNFLWAKNYDAEPWGTGIPMIDLDQSANVLASGSFKGTVDFDPGAGNANLVSNGGKDCYVLKLDASGNYLWAKSFGGTMDDEARDIHVDLNNNIYTTGFNNQGMIDFDPGPSSFNLSTPFGGSYISALNNAGNFVWAAQNGGSLGLANGWQICADASNNIISVGNFNMTVDFDPGAGVANLQNLAGSGPGQLYVQKLGALPNAGIENNNTAQTLSVFPNPSFDFINIRSGSCQENATLKIMDINGEIVLNKSVNMVEGNTIIVDISALSNGVYIVQLESWIGKVIKK